MYTEKRSASQNCIIARGGGGTCYVGVSGDVPFSRVYFKILEQDINFEEKF